MGSLGHYAAVVNTSRPVGVNLALVAIALLFIAFNLFLSPNGSDVPSVIWLMYFRYGICFSEPAMLAIWAALGSGSALYRLPVTIAVLVITILADGYTALRWNVSKWNASRIDNYHLNLSIVAGYVGIFVILFITFTLLRRWARLRIMHSTELTSDVVPPKNQFGVRYLIGLMTICAMLMTVGRNFRGDWGGPTPGTSSHFILTTLIATLLILLVLPSSIIPFLALTKTLRWMPFLLLILSWPPSLWLAVEISNLLDGAPPNRLDVAVHMFVIQLGALFSGSFAAMVLRIVGLRAARAVSPQSKLV
jgi:hypothetical protein